MNIRRRYFPAFLALSISLCSSGQTTNKPAKHSCWDTAMSQSELNECAGKDFREADAELNRVYSTLLVKLRHDPAATQSLKESERTWVAFRDAQMKALHLHPEHEGTVSPMCRSSQAARLTTERIKS
ncbi:MAG: lysozyme inhibitor LprI family protein [Candidatus Korobacteraceae bacterium]